MVVSYCNLIRLIRNLLDDDAMENRTDGAAVPGHAENSSK